MREARVRQEAAVAAGRSIGLEAAAMADDTDNGGKAKPWFEEEAEEVQGDYVGPDAATIDKLDVRLWVRQGCAQDNYTMDEEGCAIDPNTDLIDKFDVRLSRCQDELLQSLGSLLQDFKDNILAKIDGHEQRLQLHHQELSNEWGEQLKSTQEAVVDKVQTMNQFPRIRSLVASTGSTDQADDLPTHCHSSKRQITAHIDLDKHDEHFLNAANSIAREQLRTSGSGSVEGHKGPSFAELLVNSQRMEMLIFVAIVTNAIFIGIQTELAARQDGTEDNIFVFLVSTFYTLLFAIELLLRIYAKGVRRFLSCRESQWQWNYLDSVIVMISLLETIMELVVRGSDESERKVMQDSSQFRLIRMVRLTRLSRGLRITRLVSFIGALRALVHQIAHTVKSMCWAMLLLLLILYLFAILFTQGLTMFQIELGDDFANLETADLLRCYWATLPRSMFTLFKSITGGISWQEAVAPLSSMNGMWVALFLAYVCFTQLTVLNVITGFFCQNAIESAQLDQDLVTQQILAKKKMYLEQVHALFRELDADDNGTITIQEFEDHLDSDLTRAYFDSLGLDASDVWTLFKLMDIDKNCQIHTEEFVNGCMRLKGDAKGLDVAKLTYEHKFLSKQLAKFVQRTDRALSLLTGGTFHTGASTQSFHSGEPEVFERIASYAKSERSNESPDRSPRKQPQEPPPG